MDVFKSSFWRGITYIKYIFGIYNQQRTRIKIATSISVGIGFLLINKLYKKYKYNQKQFELTTNNLCNKVILITGCGSGIGETLALKLNKLGFIVIATCRRKQSVDKYLSNKSFIENTSTSYQLDVASNENILNIKQKIKQFVEENNYILWGIVNNAGIFYFAPFEFQTHDDLKKQINVNIYGTINVCHEFVPLLYGRCNKLTGYKAANGGRIVNISSLGAKLAAQCNLAYITSKAAISHFSHGLRIELSPRFGIWCSTMELGAFKTKLIDTDLLNDQFNEIIKHIDRDEIKTYYNIKKERNLRDFFFQQKDGVVGAKQDLNIAVDDILHSLTAKYPKQTYSSGVPFFLHWIIWLMGRYHFMERIIHGTAAGLENYDQ